MNLEQEIQALLSQANLLGPGTFDAVASDIDSLTDQVEKIRKELNNKPSDEKNKEEIEENDNMPSLEEIFDSLYENEEEFEEDRMNDFTRLKKNYKR